MALDREERGPQWSIGQQDERDRWQISQYGHVRNGFRTLEEPTDERPLMYYPHPFWRDGDQEGRYVKAVRACPVSKYGSLDVFAYLREVALLAEGMEPLTFPRSMLEATP